MPEDARRFARYIAVTTKIMSVRMRADDFTAEQRQLLGEYIRGGEVNLWEVPTKTLERFFYAGIDRWARSPLCRIISEQAAVVNIKGPKGAATIVAQNTEFLPDEEKCKGVVEKYDKEQPEAAKALHEGSANIADVLDRMGDDEAEWDRLYKMLDEGMKKRRKK